MRPGYQFHPRSRSVAFRLGLVLAMSGLAGCGGGSSSDDQSAKQLLELQQAKEAGKKEAQEEARAKALNETASQLRAEVKRLKNGGSSSSKKSSSGSSASNVSSGSSGGGSSARNCSGGMTVNSVTSCEFGEAVRDAYSNSGGSSSISAYSPVTGKAYSMSCSGSGATTCTGGNNASVTFP